ncbi:hypothetical protein [Rubellicoccus peritrichatus]|uniref:Uncharacterized protein n=1 Tax=Rubellicoccus peritrichatus TaxID=3080537 RepID=A0AAQ3QS12_9BACT|nr:hypothetical protein [Puniceicoccus sp. CR14]WOO39856.1 hypothetical protein RZN69_14620 [Puniceicoccus sp. CR14]
MSLKREKQKAKEAREASLGGALVLAAISLLLGILLGVYNLAAIPVNEVREMPPEEEIQKDVVYYVQGQERGGNSYRSKEAALFDSRPGSVALNEAELNTWSRNTFKFGAPAKPGEEEEETYVTLKPAAPKFRIHDNLINISMSMEVEIFGKSQKVLVQSEGTFSDATGVWEFVPLHTYIGSARIPPDVAAPQLVSKLMNVFEQSEDYEKLYAMWNNLSGVEVSGDELILAKK